MRTIRVLFSLCVLAGCSSDPLGRARTDAGPTPPGTDAALDGPVGAPTDSGSPAEEPDGYVPPPPPAARPPMPPPDHSHVIRELAAERPDLLEGSCVARGGSNEFLFEAVRRLRAIDPRWGLDRQGDGFGQDLVDYAWGEGPLEGSREVYVVDVITSHCGIPGMHPPAAPGWIDVSERGGTWTILPLTGEPLPPVDAGPPIDSGTPMPSGPPDQSEINRALAAERPDLLAASCVADGGNNEYLFELVRRLRATDVRWGLNWKRGVVGDMSQDAITYEHSAAGPVEGSTDVFILDVIGGHCGPSPAAAWIDVTEATRLGGTIGRWTLAGRTDLGP